MRLLFLFLLLVNGLVYLWHDRFLPVGLAKVVPPSRGGERLVLLSEKPVATSATTAPDNRQTPQDSARDDIAAAVVDADAPLPSQTRCYTVGPFMNENDLSTAVQGLMLSGRPFERRMSEKKEQIGYWVFIPPLKDLQAARARARELKGAGDKHFYVVKDLEGYTNAISLGVFGSRENARRRYTQIRNLGYEVKLEGRYRQNPAYWLDFTEQPHHTPLDIQQFSGAQRLPRACQAIASSP